MPYLCSRFNNKFLNKTQIYEKLIFTLAIILGVSSVASAQEPGQMWVGGSVGISSTSIKGGDSYLNFKIMPEFGYILSENIGIGISLGYHQTELDVTQLMSDYYMPSKVQGFSVAPFVRYSFLKGDIGGLFIDGGVGYHHLKNKDTDLKINMFEVGFKPGVAINVSDRIALTAKYGFLGYEHMKAGDGKVNSFGFDFDLSSALFGVSIVF